MKEFDPVEFVRKIEDRAEYGKYAMGDGPSSYQVIAATIRELAELRNDLDSQEGAAAAYELEYIADQVMGIYEGYLGA